MLLCVLCETANAPGELLCPCRLDLCVCDHGAPYLGAASPLLTLSPGPGARRKTSPKLMIKQASPQFTHSS